LVLGPSQVPVAIERATGAQPPPTTVPPTTVPPATVPASTVPAAPIPGTPTPAAPVDATPPPPPVLDPSNVQLPATGGRATDLLVFAAGLVVLGVILRSQRRRTIS
jgi:LPXTG-motif cell wall-anchored protein